MIHLRRDPDGDTIMEPTSTSGTYISDTTDHIKEIASLRQQISELKERLAQVTAIKHYFNQFSFPSLLLLG